MPRILPAAGTWPAVLPAPEGTIEPGFDHLDTQVQAVVEAHNYMAGYHLLNHTQSHWPGRATIPAVAAGWMEVAGPVGLTVVAEFCCIPRHGALGMWLYLRTDSSAGGTIRATCLEDLSTTGAVAFGVGPTYGSTSWVYVPPGRGETLTTIRIELASAGAWAAIYELGTSDADLTAGTLP